jgi:hypothetical protein
MAMEIVGSWTNSGTKESDPTVLRGNVWRKVVGFSGSTDAWAYQGEIHEIGWV